MIKEGYFERRDDDIFFTNKGLTLEYLWFNPEGTYPVKR